MKSLKNVQIGDNDLIGNKFNGHNLHIYLNKIGVESYHLIANLPLSKDKKTFRIGTFSSQNYRYKMIEADKYYNIVGGSNTLQYDLIYNEIFLNSDAVHMHLIQNYMFNLNLLPLSTSLKPTVWTLHDPFPLTGHCVHFYDCLKWKDGCGDCPKLKIPFKIKKDSTALNWEMKRIAFQNSQLTLIVASKWMEKLVKQSVFFKHCKVHLVPFGIDQNIFKLSDTIIAKKKLGISKDSITLMFRMDKNEYKGCDLLQKILPQLKSRNGKKITLITVATKGLLKHLKNDFNILEYGWIDNDVKLTELYQACDIFLMPSKVESFGMMAIEAMSVGKPVIVLKGSALQDVVNAPHAGIACERNSEDLRKTVQHLIDNEEERIKRGQLCYSFAKEEYNLDKYLKRIINVYKDAIKNHKPSIYRDKVIEQLLKHKPISEKSVYKKPGRKIIYFLSFIPLFKIFYSIDYIRIQFFLFRNITLFKLKFNNKYKKYYFFGIPILRIKKK